MCQKFNYALDEGVQNYKCYNAIIEFSKDLKYITITNRKPNENGTKYSTITDPREIEELKMREMLRKNETKLLGNQKEDKDFIHKKSSASCYVDDI